MWWVSQNKHLDVVGVKNEHLDVVGVTERAI